MIISRYFEPIFDKFRKSIFLAGPTYRDKSMCQSNSWRIEALKILENLNFDGIVYVPEFLVDFDNINYSKEDIMSWEQKALEATTVILYWLPRSKELLGLTTNIEFGFYYRTNKQIVGFPLNALHMDYITFCCNKKNIQVYHTLFELCLNSIELANKLLNKDKVLFESKGKFLTVKEHYKHNYYYSERLGVDSVAFILKDKHYFYMVKERKIANEEKEHFKTSTIGAFGGSIDKEHLLKLQTNNIGFGVEDFDLRLQVMKEIVQIETLEEAGYKVNLVDIEYVGNCLVSTQSNQNCYLFIVNIEDSIFQGRQPENSIEAEMEIIKIEYNPSMLKKYIQESIDWKAITILSKLLF